MIGLDQEPNEAARSKLNAALGEGLYAVEYRETPHGVAILVTTREVPSRVWSSQVANGVGRASVDGVWDALTARITAEVKGAVAITGQDGVVAQDMGTIGGDDSRSLEEAAPANPESHGYPPIPDDLIKPRDVEADAPAGDATSTRRGKGGGK